MGEKQHKIHSQVSVPTMQAAGVQRILCYVSLGLSIQTVCIDVVRCCLMHYVETAWPMKSTISIWVLNNDASFSFKSTLR